MRLRLFLRSTSWNIFGVALTTFLGLVVTSRIVKILGPAAWGAWAVCQQLLASVALLDFGVYALLPRDVARLRNQHNAGPAIPLLIATSLKTVVTLVIPATATFNLVLVVASRYGHLYVVGPLLLCAGNLLLLSLPFRLAQQVLVGMLDVDFVASLNFATSLLASLAMLAAVHLGYGVMSIVALWGLQQFVLGVASVLRLRVAFPQLLPSFEQLRRSRFTIATQNAWVAASQLCHVALNSSDLLFIGKLLGLSEVTSYACTGRVLSVASAVPGAAAQASGPFIASLAVDRRAGQAAAALALCVACIASWIAAGVVVANKAFVTIWVGGHLFGGPALTLALAGCFLLTQVGGALVQIAFNLGDVRVPQVAMMGSSLLFLVTCPFFIRKSGPLGAALALLLSISIASIPLLLWAARRASSKFGGFSYLLVDWAIRALAVAFVGFCWSREDRWRERSRRRVCCVIGVTGLANSALFGGVSFTESRYDRSFFLGCFGGVTGQRECCTPFCELSNLGRSLCIHCGAKTCRSSSFVEGTEGGAARGTLG